jgi:hypothetical protein
MAGSWLPLKRSASRGKNLMLAFPRVLSIVVCERGGMSLKDLRYVVFYDKPPIKFERLLETYVSFAAQGDSVLSHRHPRMAEGKVAT